MSEEKCDHCHEPGRLGPEIRAYKFMTPKGGSVVRFLHASDGGKPCYADYKARVDAYLAEKQKVATNG